ncbi:MAG: serine hydrolase [Acidobacteriota bacterium]
MIRVPSFGARCRLALRLGACACLVATSVTPSFGASGDADQVVARRGDELVGLWSAERRSGPRLRGSLVVERDGADVLVRLGGVAATARFDGDRLDVAMPHDLGRLRVRVDGDGLRGHWIQPPGEFLSGSWATPVVLDRLPSTAPGDASPATWRGSVEPLDDRLTLFLAIERDPARGDGALRGFLRNPERNIGVYLRLGAVVLDGGEAVLQRADGSELGRARRHTDPERLSLHVQGTTFDFARVDPAAALGFAPRIEAPPLRGLVRPTARADGWRVAAPAEVGLDQTRLSAFVDRLRAQVPRGLREPALQALLVARGGHLVVEEYFGGFHAERPHDTRSAGKTLSSLLVGTAVDRDLVAVDDHVLAHVGARWPVADLESEPDPRLAALRVEHLLTMSSGFDCDDDDSETPGSEDRMQSQDAQPDWIRYILDVPMVRMPGTRGVYCTAALNLLGGVLTEATGTWLPRLVDERLMRPLDIEHYHLNLMPTGDAYLGGGWHLRPRDFLKFGQLVLDGGEWNGERVVSADWLARSLEPAASLNEADDYGYAWWLSTAPYGEREVEVAYASGNGGQLLLVVPSLDLAVVFMGGNYGDYGTWRAFREEWLPRELLPAVIDPRGLGSER